MSLLQGWVQIPNVFQDFGLGLGMTFVPMNVAAVKQTGRHSFSLITPYKTFKWVTSCSFCTSCSPAVRLFVIF